MAKSSPQPDKGTSKPETPAQPAPSTAPRVISSRVFSDFAAI